MEFKINTEKKIITIGNGVNIGALVEFLKMQYSRGEWKKFTIQNELPNYPYLTPIYVREWWNPLPVVTYCNDLNLTGNKPIDLPSLPVGTYSVELIGEPTAQN